MWQGFSDRKEGGSDSLGLWIVFGFTLIPAVGPSLFWWFSVDQELFAGLFLFTTVVR